MTERITLSKTELDVDRLRAVRQVIAYKPSGLWYGCGHVWEQFASASPLWKRRGYRHRYAMGVRSSELLKLDAKKSAIGAFMRRYGVPERVPGDEDESWMPIDWRAVEKAGYAGVEICPYRRFSTMPIFYDQWDVASGCVWDPRAIDWMEER